MSSNEVPGKKIRRLSDIVREARMAAAERADAAANISHADRARLELLAEELEPIFDEVPDDDDQFDFFLSSGERPRLWIDAIAHVHMGTDRRTYRFVRDTREGRVVIAETADMAAMADSVARYVAERIVRRQRFLDSDTLLPGQRHKQPLLQLAANAAKPASEESGPAPASAMPAGALPAASQRPERKFGLVAALLWFIFGAAVAGAVMASAFWEQIAPRISAL